MSLGLMSPRTNIPWIKVACLLVKALTISKICLIRQSWYCLIQLYYFACHFKTTYRILIKFWILAFQRPISKYYFWSQVYKHLQVVVIVLWKWSFLAFLQGKVVKFSRPVAGVRPGVKITFLPLKAFNILPWNIPNWKIKWANNFYICP